MFSIFPIEQIMTLFLELSRLVPLATEISSKFKCARTSNILLIAPSFLFCLAVNVDIKSDVRLNLSKS